MPMPMDILLLVFMVALLGFMFWSSRRRQQKMKDEQAAKSRALLPGVKVLLQGGLYGTLVTYDADDLSKSAEVELAPGMVVEVHSQAILRVVEDEVLPEAEFDEALEDQAEYQADVAEGLIVPDAPAAATPPATDARPDTDGDTTAPKA